MFPLPPPLYVGAPLTQQYAVCSELSFSDLVGMKQCWFQVGCGSSDPLDKTTLCLFGKKSVPAAKTTVYFVIMEMEFRFAVENKGLL
jgi:hypothetical protein